MSLRVGTTSGCAAPQQNPPPPAPLIGDDAVTDDEFEGQGLEATAPPSPSESVGPFYARAGGTTWPVNVGEVEWQLRYGDPAAVRLVAASIVSAYHHLTDSSLREATAITSLRRARQAVRCEMPTNGLLTDAERPSPDSDSRTPPSGEATHPTNERTTP